MKKLIAIALSVFSMFGCSNTVVEELETDTELNEAAPNDLLMYELDGNWETFKIVRNDSIDYIEQKNKYRIEFLANKTANIKCLLDESKSKYEYLYDAKSATYIFMNGAEPIFQMKVTEIMSDGRTFIALINDLKSKQIQTIYFAKMSKVSVDVDIDTEFEE